MSTNENAKQPAKHTARPSVERSRRNFLLLFPFGVLASIAATLAAAALRFLRPAARAAQVGTGAAEQWAAVAPVSELSTSEPLARKVGVRREAGWASAFEERTVYVLPAQADGKPRVLSAVCPHEGCEVAWDAGEKSFLCPCHDSRFDPTGARLTGPAERGLAELPSRVTGDALEIQYPQGAASGAETNAVASSSRTDTTRVPAS